MTIGKWTKENFEIHHENNPRVYELFCRFALQSAKKRDHFSAKMVYFRIRWFTQVEENDSQFKLDDGWVSHYARKFMEDYPEYKDFFETRVRNDSYFEGEQGTYGTTDLITY